MKKMTVYDIYLDDGRDAMKVTVPAESRKAAEQYVQGNGEVIAIRENPILQDIDLGALSQTLKNSGWGQLEIDVITRALIQVGLDRR